MRPRTVTLIVALAATAAGLIATAPGASAGSGGEVLAIESGQGVFQIRGRGYLNMRIDQGTVQIVDLTPSDQFSPRLGGVPRGKTSGTTGSDINVIVLGGRYKVVVRGSGISVSARGEGVVVMSGEPDATGSTGTIRIGDAVRPVPVGDSKASFGGSQGSQGSDGSGSSGSRSGRDGPRS